MAGGSGRDGPRRERSGTRPRSKRPPAGRRRSPVGPGLWIVATPIGNLSDVTLRALEVLAAADLIACEDTRVTARLLNAHGIDTAMVSYHEHNAERVRPGLIQRLEMGETVALVSDAGTPLVSDPGYKLVRAALDAGLPVSTAPGPSAALAALVLSGLPSDRVLFAGFLPAKAAARRKALAELAAVPATLVAFESPHRLKATLKDMAAVLGPREAAVARELTKLYEEVLRGGLGELAERFQGIAPRGEVAIVVGPPEARTGEPVDEAALDARLEAALAEMSVRDAAASVAAATGLPRRQVYARALALAGARPG